MVSRGPAVAYVNKYGMTFILDRETGKPLLPIPEVKVPVSTVARREHAGRRSRSRRRTTSSSTSSTRTAALHRRQRLA